jgi:hypothetical protein
MLMTVKIPHESFNAAVRDGSAEAKLKKILEAIKPEAAYFTSQHGCRGGVFVVDLPDAAHIPTLAEPWFLTFNADVEFHPCMTPADLGKSGIGQIAKQW